MVARSGSFDMAFTADQICIEALERCQVKEIGNVADEEVLDSARVTLNLVLKAKQAAGLFAFTRFEAILFLEVAKKKYLLGPTGDHCALAEDVISTALTSSALAAATTLVLDDDDGIEDEDVIGIVLDDGSIHWTTVQDITGFTITDPLPSAAAAGNLVFSYTDLIQRPMKVENLRVVDSSGSEIPLLSPLSRQAYEFLPNKSAAGTPNQTFVDPKLDNAELSLWNVPDTSERTIHFDMQRPVDDLDEPTDGLCVPVDWYEWVVAELAVKLGLKLDAPPALYDRLVGERDRAANDLPDSRDGALVIRPYRRRRYYA